MSLQIILVVEPGPLEWQVEYALRSLRRFGQVPDARVWVISPRGKSLSPDTYRFLEAQKVTYVEENLNPTWGFHPLANKVFASRFVEARTDDPLLFLDSDMLVLGSLESLATAPGGVRVKTAHNSFAAARDRNDPFWSPLFASLNIPADNTWTTVASGEVAPTLAYYNTGVVAVHARDRLFVHWAETYEAVERKLPELFRELQGYAAWPAYHRKSRRQKQLYHIGQILFALTLFRHYQSTRVQELSVKFNYPLPKHALLGRQKIESLDEVTLLHYHREFRDPLWFTRFEASPELTRWLITTLYG